MSEISVVIIGTDAEERQVLQMQVDGTAVAKTVQTFPAMPVAMTDPMLRRIQELTPDVIMVDIPKQASPAALRAIELLRAGIPHSAIFAIGETHQPQVIISAMRSGAREFLDRPTSTNALLEAFVRLTSSQRKTQASTGRGKVYTFLNTKGGSGATTVAVNTAINLQKISGSCALIDLAPLGHAALHLNVRPSFTIADVARNLQRLDHALLESYMTRGPGGLQLLAGVTELITEDLLSSDLARLFDTLVSNFKYVVVDASSRLDRFIKLVCDLSDNVLLVAQPDVTSLWSASKLQDFVGDNIGENRVRLVINRYRKIPGLTDADIERHTHIKTIYKVPNQFHAVASSIERGVPVVTENHTDISKAFVSFTSSLTGTPVDEKGRKAFSLFGGA